MISPKGWKPKIQNFINLLAVVSGKKEGAMGYRTRRTSPRFTAGMLFHSSNHSTRKPRPILFIFPLDPFQQIIGRKRWGGRFLNIFLLFLTSPSPVTQVSARVRKEDIGITTVDQGNVHTRTRTHTHTLTTGKTSWIEDQSVHQAAVNDDWGRWVG